MARKKKEEHYKSEVGYKRRTKYPVTPERFVEVWTTSNSLEEVAERLKMPASIVSARVATYRKHGANLKKMPRKNNRQLNIEKLNALIKELTPLPTEEELLGGLTKERVVTMFNAFMENLQKEWGKKKK